MRFVIHKEDIKSRARVCELVTNHGVIQTPIFLPVGTAGTVKGVHQRELTGDISAEIILANAYHLFMRPGMEIIEEAGGLHTFMGWNNPILTDSGGYQVYSLAESRKITEEGVSFRSHIDGSKHFFSPEKVIDIQRSIGSDIIMAFDECTPYPCDFDYAKKSMELTHRWLKRSCDQFDRTSPKYRFDQNLFPIVQGSVYPELRKISAQVVAGLGRAGNAIGGLSVGEPAEMMYEMTELVCGILPIDKPRYLMGVGTPANILESIAMGVDMFDCVMPTRNARNGMIFTREGIINIRNEKWKNDFSPIDPDLEGYVSQHYSKAYLRHLVNSKEILGAQIASLQNLTLYLWLVNESRKKIINGSFVTWKDTMVPVLSRRL